MQTRPAEEVATQADDRIFGGVQTDVALKGAVLAAIVRCRTRRVAGRGPSVFSRGSGHLTGNPLLSTKE